MSTVTLQVENMVILPSLKKVLSALNGVTIVKTTHTHTRTKTKSGIEQALKDAKCGRVSESFTTTEALFNHLGI